MQILGGFSEIAGVGGKDDLDRSKLEPKRVMARRVTMVGYRHERAVAEQVIFVVDLLNLVAVILVRRYIGVFFIQLGHLPGYLFFFWITSLALGTNA